MGNMYWPTALTKPVQIYSRRLRNRIRIQFAAPECGHVLASIPAFVWQPRQRFNADCLVPFEVFSLERFRGVVRQQLLH